MGRVILHELLIRSDYIHDVRTGGYRVYLLLQVIVCISTSVSLFLDQLRHANITQRKVADYGHPVYGGEIAEFSVVVRRQECRYSIGRKKIGVAGRLVDDQHVAEVSVPRRSNVVVGYDGRDFCFPKEYTARFFALFVTLRHLLGSPY